VSTLGDVLTLPALYLATGLLGLGLLTSTLGWALAGAAIAALVLGARSDLPQLQRIVRSSIPVLLFAGLVSSLAGVALERRLGTFAALPALLILVPAHLSSSGALGGILSGRLSSQLLLGLAPPSAVPSRAARRDLLFVVGLSIPVFIVNGAGAHFVARALGEESPGLGHLVAASVLAGVLAMVVVLAIAYYGTIAAVRLDVDEVVHRVDRAREEAEHGRGEERLACDLQVEGRVSGRRRAEQVLVEDHRRGHEQVLHPLVRPNGLDEAFDHGLPLHTDARRRLGL